MANTDKMRDLIDVYAESSKQVDFQAAVDFADSRIGKADEEAVDSYREMLAMVADGHAHKV